MASPFVIHDPEFLRALGDAPRLDWVVDVDAHEGPVYIAHADALYFTSLPTPDWRVAIRRIALDGGRFPLAVDRVETVVENTSVANGMTLGADGHLLVCEQGSMAERAAISRVDPGARHPWPAAAPGGGTHLRAHPRLDWLIPLHDYIQGDNYRPRRLPSDGRTGRIARNRGLPHIEGVTP